MENKSKIKRNKYIVNAKIQIRTALFIVGINFFAFIFICGALYFSSESFFRKTHQEIENLNKTIETQQNITRAFKKFARSVSSDAYDVIENKVTKDNNKSLAVIQNHIDELLRFLSYYKYIFLFLVILQIIQSFFLFRYFIRFSHRFLGPEKVIRMTIKKIASGKKFPARPLREKDMLMELYSDVMLLAKKKGLIIDLEKKAKKK